MIETTEPTTVSGGGRPPLPEGRSRLRRALTVGLTSGAVIVSGGVASLTVLYTNADHNTAGKIAFDQVLPVPPLAKSTMENGTRVFRLDLRKGEADFGHNLTSDSLYGQDATPGAAANGAQYLAPTLRASNGENVRVEVTNELGSTSSIHWHGMHLPATMDGGPHQPISAGTTWSPHWKVNQPAATLWYHPHPHGATEQQVAKGLAGVFLLDDRAGQATQDLPHTYGVDDIPVVLQGKAFKDGKPTTNHSVLSTTGTLGDQILANGKAGATFTASTQLVRLRLVNGSTARIMHLGFTDNRTMQVIAGDGGLLQAPRPVTRVTLSPGDRTEVVMSVEPADLATLRNYPIDLAGFPAQRQSGGDDTLDVLQIRAADRLTASRPLPEHLADLPAVDKATVAARRTFNLEKPTINGERMDMQRVDFAVTGGTSEIWTVHNSESMPHNFHVHDVQYRVLTLDEKAPPVEMQGRQDTVLIKGGQTVRLLVSFANDTADASTPYMFHCHLLWHEDQGMMGQFVINPAAPNTSGTGQPEPMNHMTDGAS